MNRLESGMPDRKAVIFDVDGVLVDSFESHFQSWHALAQECGFSFTRKQFAGTFGMTSRAIIRRLWGESAGLSDERIGEMDDRKEALFREIVEEDFPAMDGAESLIRQLRDAGFRLAVGSSGPPENVNLVLERLGVRDMIAVAITGRDVSRGKPDPQVFQLASERLGVLADRCVVIEDAPAGIAAAHAAGLRAIGLVSTGRTFDELSDAELCVASLRDLDSATISTLIERNAARDS
jgi:beta-phosphoglucomutase